MPHRADPEYRSDNECCPRFVALAAGDSYVESDDSLDALLAVLSAEASDAKEDVVVWHDFHTIAALVLADGSVHRILGSPSGSSWKRRRIS
jgi:hypothetical protein